MEKREKNEKGRKDKGKTEEEKELEENIDLQTTFQRLCVVTCL